MLSAIDVFKAFNNERMAIVKAESYMLLAEMEALRTSTRLSTMHAELSQLLRPTYTGPTDYFRCKLFISQISAFELFLQEMMLIAVQRYPKKAGAVQFRLAEIVVSEKSELVQRAAQDLIYKMMYRKPMDYLADLCEVLSIPSVNLEDSWRDFVEAKARRDVGVHNGWVCNDTYLRKLKEAEIKSDVQLLQSLVPRDNAYWKKISGAVDALAKEIAEHAASHGW